MDGAFTAMVCDGHFIRYVEIREVERGTVSSPTYRVVLDETLPVSPEARAALDKIEGES